VINWVVVGQLIAKFHYTGPTGPDLTKSADFVGGIRQSPRFVGGLCLVGTGRASVVEFSYERQLILGSGLVVQVVSALLRGNIIGKISTDTTHSARSLGDS